MSEDAITYGNYWTPERMSSWLKTAVKDIRNVVELDVDNSNPPELMEKLKELSAITSTAAMAQATAKKLLLHKQKELIKSLPTMSPSLQVKWLQGELFDEEGMLTYCERLSAAVSNSIEAIRSILSYTKSEMEQSKHQV